MADRRELLQLMADLLEYPGHDTVEKVRRCEQLLCTARPRAAEQLREFISFAEAERAEKLEELYTATFDLNPQCYPYAGYQLFGEDPKRSELMVGLRSGYRAAGFDFGTELPDYMPVLMRFLSQLQDKEAESELADLVIMPALEKMAGTLVAKENPYSNLVSAAQLLLRDR